MADLNQYNQVEVVRKVDNHKLVILGVWGHDDREHYQSFD